MYNQEIERILTDLMEYDCWEELDPLDEVG